MQTFSHPVIYFEIPVLDLERAMKFYEAVFNVTFEKRLSTTMKWRFFPYTIIIPAYQEPWLKAVFINLLLKVLWCISELITYKKRLKRL